MIPVKNLPLKANFVISTHDLSTCDTHTVGQKPGPEVWGLQAPGWHQVQAGQGPHRVHRDLDRREGDKWRYSGIMSSANKLINNANIVAEIWEKICLYISSCLRSALLWRNVQREYLLCLEQIVLVWVKSCCIKTTSFVVFLFWRNICKENIYSAGLELLVSSNFENLVSRFISRRLELN